MRTKPAPMRWSLVEYLQDQFQAALDELRNALAELSETNEKMIAKVQAPEEKINKDRHNSNNPPSSDGVARRFSRKRQPSGKKPGGQKGHEGTTFAMVKDPRHLRIHQVKSCNGCGRSLQHEKPRGYEPRLVFDIPPHRRGGHRATSPDQELPAMRRTYSSGVPRRGESHHTVRHTAEGVCSVSEELWISLLRSNRPGVA